MTCTTDSTWRYVFFCSKVSDLSVFIMFVLSDRTLWPCSTFLRAPVCQFITVTWRCLRESWGCPQWSLCWIHRPAAASLRSLLKQELQKKKTKHCYQNKTTLLLCVCVAVEPEITQPPGLSTFYDTKLRNVIICVTNFCFFSVLLSLFGHVHRSAWMGMFSNADPLSFVMVYQLYASTENLVALQSAAESL